MFNDGRFYPNTCLNSKGHIKLNISSYIHPPCDAPPTNMIPKPQKKTKI